MTVKNAIRRTDTQRSRKMATVGHPVNIRKIRPAIELRRPQRKMATRTHTAHPGGVRSVGPG